MKASELSCIIHVASKDGGPGSATDNDEPVL